MLLTKRYPAKKLNLEYFDSLIGRRKDYSYLSLCLVTSTLYRPYTLGQYTHLQPGSVSAGNQKGLAHELPQIWQKFNFSPSCAICGMGRREAARGGRVDRWLWCVPKLTQWCSGSTAVARGDAGRGIIISGKRDFKYFMLLKLAAKKEKPKTMKNGWSRGRSGRKGALSPDARALWLS